MTKLFSRECRCSIVEKPINRLGSLQQVIGSATRCSVEHETLSADGSPTSELIIWTEAKKRLNKSESQRGKNLIYKYGAEASRNSVDMGRTNVLQYHINTG